MVVEGASEKEREENVEVSRIDEKSDVTEDSDEEEWFGYVDVTYTKVIRTPSNQWS